ncbi:MAG: EAL domain-containing protein [Alphaproteobacteria bacterium]|nr:EAL domain-containing protein [Alphaproteobacteria bacterium]
MSDLAQMAFPEGPQDAGPNHSLAELVDLLVASGDLFYEWELGTDVISWTGDTATVVRIADDSSLASGDAFLNRIHPEDLPHRMIALSRHLEQQESFDREFRLRDDAGQFVWVQERAIVTRSETGHPVRLTGTVRNIDALKKSEQEVSFLANHDALTGHYNRLRLREALDHTITQSQLTRQQGGLLLVGLDKLNAVADVYGEDTADTIVLSAARRIETCMRTGDTIGRVGFDRFAVVVNRCSRSELATVAGRFLAAIRETPVSTPAGAMTITASVGISVFPDDGDSAGEIVAHADDALRGARRLGCDCYLEYSDVPQHTRTERPDLVVAEQVKQALKENRFKLAFQPVVSSETGEVAFYEGLARMIDTDGSPIAAGGFVPVVEQMGLMRLIDRKVLDLGLDTLERNPDMKLSINVSGMTAVDSVWLRRLEDRLQDRPDLASRLILEITETVALDDIDEASRFVSTLTQFGCRVALDDFGAGFTSFRHLRSLNVALVKIDGSYIRDILQNPENLLFVRTLINLAKGIGLECVAEWVETGEEAELLREEGVELLQGWHCGKPEIDPDWMR